MRLNNIIYDVNSLATAITEQWNAESPTFQAIYPSDTATSLVNGFSAYGAMLQYMLVSTMANCYTSTAFSPTGIYQLADTLGNDLHGNVSSQVTVNVTKNNFIGTNIVVPANTQFVINEKKFFNPSAIILPAVTPTVTEVVLVQGEIIEVNKYSNGIENEKFYFSTDFKANHNYVKVKVNGEEWTVADSFLPYDKNYVTDASEMNVCVLKTDPDGRSYIKVGNNQLGNMPSSGSNIQIQYVSNDGDEGNISESNTTGTLADTLMFIDETGNQSALDVTITTTTTAYGGFGKQSIETLQYTSPYVFASGHRAIRRQDYNALLQNKCGYLTSAVWGEYEEADKIGAYDSLMMNMVYYTGVKAFQTYPYFTIGYITDPSIFGGILNSIRGFWGSFSYRIRNLKNSAANIIIQDTGAKGQLFNNDNKQDPRDSILPDWISTISKEYTARLTANPIATSGSGYLVNEELVLQNTNNELLVRVTNIDTNGNVLEIVLLKSNVSEDYTKDHPNPFTTAYSGTPGGGTGLTVNISISEMDTSTVITTNDDRGMIPAPAQLNPIINARSDQSDLKYYQSLWTPTLLSPVQIIFKFKDLERAITGIKFKATDPNNGPFIGTMSMFGTNIDPMPSLDNVRNSENWERVIDRVYLTTPYGNTNDNWTDWFPTNCFKGTSDISGKPEYNKYKYYVLEFYSCEDNGETNPLITFSKMKVMYSEDSSIIYYEENGKTEMNFPVAGSPGPGGTEDGYLTEALLNTSTFPMYGYNVTLNGITSANGYRDGNILAYIFKNDTATIPFLIEITNIDNGVFKITSNGTEALAGTEYISLATPASLDETLVYKSQMVLDGGRIPVGKGGIGYKPNDIVSINGSDGKLTVRIATVDASGTVLGAVWVNNMTFNQEFKGEYETTLISSPEGSNGSGLELTLESELCSGRNGVPGKNATISITSSDNLQVDASFTGNRIDTKTINHLDQPIIDQYNHFTTFLEFKQPEIIQVKININISLAKDAPITSGIIIQNVKNNVSNLFNLTPDFMGKGLKLSDVYTAVMKTPYVDWCKVTSPLDNIDIPKNGLMILSSVDVVETNISFK